MIEASPGLGKTSLLDGTAEIARRRGFTVERATGSSLERDVPHGLIRQLFERSIAALDERRRREVLGGAVALSRPLFDHGSEPVANLADSAALHRSLFWLTSNLAEAGPLMLCVDDAHLADPESLAWFAHLARRLDDIPVVLVVACRPPGEPSPELSALAEAAGGAIDPRPLSADGVERFLRGALRREPGRDVASVSAEMTGGNPQLLRSLAQQMLLEGDVSAQSARRLGSAAVSEAAISRLDRLDVDAQTAARAIAVLGREATIMRIAMLSGLEPAEPAIDQLVTAGILRRTLPAAFAHPTLEEAVESLIPPAELARLHAAAATLLLRDGAGAEAISPHLLKAEPEGSQVVVDTLREAAALARRRGAPQAAARLLKRALAEPPDAARRAAVLEDLGRAESRYGEAESIGHLREAIELTGDAGERARLSLQLGRALTQLGRFPEAVEVFDAARDEVAGQDPERELELDAASLLTATSAGTPFKDRPAQLARLRERSTGNTRSERIALGTLASVVAMEGASAADVRELGMRALADGAMAETSGDTAPFFLTIAALVICGAYEEAETAANSAMEVARARGSTLAYGMACGTAAFLYQRWGRLADAIAAGENALEVAGPGAIPFGMPVAPAFACEAHIDRGELDDVDRILAGFDIEGHGRGNPSYDLLWHARGRLREARGESDAALEDFLTAGASQEAWGAYNPSLLPWRSSASAILLRRDEVERATELADEELRRARRFGAPHSIGVSLQAAGMARGGDERMGLLEEAVSVLVEGPELELARAQLSLGSALRRAGRERDAREPLRQALHGFFSAGATPLGERARDELVAAGGRPRRASLKGPGSLTPSEGRIIRLAAAGSSNREIAQDLFLSVKTVEMHLRNAYGKLQISSREGLATALEGTDD